MTNEFSELGLSAELLRAISAQGYTQPTPIQTQAIPPVLAGRDVLAGAQTGTGKTAAFVLPLLQRLQESGVRPKRAFIRALVLVPTRELAAQVQASVSTYGRYLPFRSMTIFGGVKINPQISQLRYGVDIVVATPGRLLDHLQQGTIHLDQVDTLVLDEADRMLDMGFIRDIRKVLRALPAKRQNLLFSATCSDEIRALASDLLSSPVEIQVARRNEAAEMVTQVVHPVDSSRKRALLAHLIGSNDWRQVLVFTRTKHGANRLAKQLNLDGLQSTAIHGNKSQAARTRALSEFKLGRLRVLVATDIAARGLDIDQLPHVVNYELPHVPEDYIHRIGRTGRAGLGGSAVSLVCGEENKLLRDIESLLQRKVDRVVVPAFQPAPDFRPAAAASGGSGGRPAARGGRPTGRSGGGRKAKAGPAPKSGKINWRSRRAMG
ncbi:MAG: DEAD/DEAH box helicase [Planctomycetes bacterium]|nr:DEAD/DEAH box helicase [Planctomycetota bacterium]